MAEMVHPTAGAAGRVVLRTCSGARLSQLGALPRHKRTRAPYADRDSAIASLFLTKSFDQVVGAGTLRRPQDNVFRTNPRSLMRATTRRSRDDAVSCRYLRLTMGQLTMNPEAVSDAPSGAVNRP
jgi:hypothetical protein